MKWTFFSFRMRTTPTIKTFTAPYRLLLKVISACVLAGLVTSASASAQVITIDTSGKGPITANAPVDRRYAQFTPTNIPLPRPNSMPSLAFELIRALQAEQGFAMRPFPRGHKGLTLVANGKLEPAGEAYLNMVIASGTSAKPGDRVVLRRQVRPLEDRLRCSTAARYEASLSAPYLDRNGRARRRTPWCRTTGDQPMGSRLTLAFNGHIPELDRRTRSRRCWRR
jgi:hypothetical protein